MLQRFILIFLVCLTFSTLGAQTPVSFPIPNDTTLTINIADSFILYLEDNQKAMTLKDLKRAVVENKMKPWDGKIPRNGQIHEGNKIWLYYRLKNNSGKTIETGLDSWSNISVFHVIRKDGKIQSDTTGDWVKWSTKKEFRVTNLVPLTLEQGETVDIYSEANFISKTFVESFRVRLIHPGLHARMQLMESEMNSVSIVDMILALMAGAMLFAALLYFFFYYLVREKVFLFFGLCVFCFGFGWTGILSVFVREHPFEVRYLIAIVQLGFLFFLFFFKEYLKFEVHLPKWNKYLHVVASLYLVALAYHLIFGKSVGQWMVTVMILVTMTSLAVSFFLLQGKMNNEKKFIRYAIIPVMAAFVLLLIFILYLNFFKVGDSFFNSKLFIWVITNYNILLAGTFIWMIISFSRLLIRRFNDQRQKIMEQEIEKEHMRAEQERQRLELMEQQKKDLEDQVAARTAELKRSLEDLKATQSQLIQSEKMASLGEMTAGIAHEIQNPLNFVNNFAEVNTEIAEDIRSEINKLIPDAEQRVNIEELLSDLSSNQDKIRTHGKRADSIVKNMLQHSRTGDAQKEPVDLNAMVDEYVRLSFHGLRARDKNLNADFEIHLDPSIGKVNILQQDFGRVILNLVNNAFYAVNDKSKSAAPGYRPKITVTTAAEGEEITIMVQDNGDGIPEKIKEKIFQPFFTTKPTGEGTGLGLSISYDIITKGHGGAMRVESSEGEGSSFIVQIPR